VDRLRRRLLAAAGGLIALPGAARAASGRRAVTDSAGRKVQVPERATRVFAAGPPASILLFALAPDSMIGWTTPFRPAERPFVPARYADLPALGRLTGRGGTANVEAVVSAKPDLVFDYGTVNPTYV